MGPQLPVLGLALGDMLFLLNWRRLLAGYMLTSDVTILVYLATGWTLQAGLK